MIRYDLAIVGSGGAAFAAAIRAADLGASAVIVERDTVGGTCVNVGCVPSKTLLAAADALHTAAAHPFAGVPTSAGAPDLGALVAQKDELVARLREAKYVDLAADHGFEIRPGVARFRNPQVLEVDGSPLEAGAYLVATGAEPRVPDLPGLAEAGYLTSTTAMALDEVPDRLVVVGGGFVGLELGQLFARLGSRVSIVGRLAPRAEPELVGWLGRVLADEGIEVVADRATAVERAGGEWQVATSGGQRIPAGAILVATGRRARVGDLGLEAAGIGLDERGFVAVDDELRTANARVFAAGDVVGGPQYVYVAAAQGKAAAANALGATGTTVDYSALPSVIFTDPALAAASPRPRPGPGATRWRPACWSWPTCPGPWRTATPGGR